MTRTFVGAQIAFWSVLISQLLFDRPGLMPQLLLGSVGLGLLLILIHVTGARSKTVFLTILVACFGEVFWSIHVGLYTYQNALIPLYVPPGHGILFILAQLSARQELLVRHQVAITRIVLILGSVYATYCALLIGDSWGVLWWLGGLLLFRFSRRPLLLAICITFSMSLEFLGTSIGNWRWADTVPYLGLSQANPPGGIGFMYIVLDVLVAEFLFRTSHRPGIEEQQLSAIRNEQTLAPT